ncbi:unnamed protein product [Arctia plantaginis]|uniref:Serpin domain-containing protein n=1 Tax=Arctia plantaginis TaxID=874455 RepID=A0A8S0ZLI7_ARCPL|nr:unnamed protein product [Arctia plantaginis]CAB3238342.1 unnamed protein product [Arctia plantaginis]
MLLKCFILWFMINYVQPQNYLLQNTYHPQDQNSVKRNPVEVERSKEISVTTTVQQGNGKKLTNEALSKGSSATQQSSQGQIVFRPQASQPQVTNADKFNRLLYSVTNVGINLLKIINSMATGNVVVSPYSVSSLLSLLQQGTSGTTQEELTRVLGMTPEALAAAYSRITTDYKNRNSHSIMKTASNVFVGEYFIINSDFQRIAQENFDSDITRVSFGRPDLAARDINKWVASKTLQKIEKIITSDALDSSTQMVLVNAIYFKGLWEVPFRVEATRLSEFHLSNGATKVTDFMRMRHSLKTGVDQTAKAKVVILPFEGNQYSLMVILPSASDGITSFLANLTDARLLSYLSFPEEETDLELPKFVVRGDTNLEIVLRNMGIATMFSSYAELNTLGTYQGYTPHISSAVHSAVLSIDEKGGSAAAATAFAAVALSYDEPSTYFKADTPFIVVLWDTKSSLPLFIAKIEDPTQ